MGKDLYTSGEIADILGIPPRTARRYITNGKIPATQNQVTGTWTITREDLIGFMKERGVDPAILIESSRILLVSNDSELLSFMTSILSKYSPDYEMLSTINGYEALIRIGELKPDLMCLDSQMKGMDPVEVVKTIKSSDTYSKVRLLVLSGGNSDAESIKTVGADDILLKPCTANEIINKVTGLLNKH